MDPGTDREIGIEPGRVEWRISDELVPYEEAVAEMETRIAAIREGTARELVWLLEHPPLYTAGTSAPAQASLDPARLPVHRTGRGGQYTYHGPGQRIAYVMLDLEKWGRDVRCHVWRLEEWAVQLIEVIFYGIPLVLMMVGIFLFAVAVSTYYGIKYGVLRFKRPPSYGPPRTWPL